MSPAPRAGALRAVAFAGTLTGEAALLSGDLGTMIAAADSPEEAHAAAENAEAAVAPQDHCRFCQIMVSVPSTIACADVGDLDGARRHLAAAEVAAGLWHGTAWQGGLLEARAHVALAEGDPAAAQRLVVEAAGCFDAAGQPRDAQRCRAPLTTPIPAPRPPSAPLPPGEPIPGRGKTEGSPRS